MFLCICKAKNGSEFKVSSLRAIRGAIDRYLKQPPHNKPWSIIDDSKFAKANQTLNAFCKNMMKEGKVGPEVHKNPTTSEQMGESFISGQLGDNTQDPSQLLRTAWSYMNLYFGKRGRENLRKLTKEKMPLRTTPQGRRYYEFRRDALMATKNYQFGLHISTDESDGKMFEAIISSRGPVKQLRISLSISIPNWTAYSNDRGDCQENSILRMKPCGIVIHQSVNPP